MAEPHNPADERNNRLAQEIENIANALGTVAKEDSARMPERNFREVFLPFFAGDEKLVYPVTIAHWLHFAGSPYHEVQVIDLSGKVLFTVPPVYDRTAINPIVGEHSSIAHVVATTGQYARIHPIQGQNYLSKELTKRALVMKVPASVLRHAVVWNEIFNRYGRPPLIALEDNPSEAPVDAAKGTINDQDDYEPI